MTTEDINLALAWGKDDKGNLKTVNIGTPFLAVKSVQEIDSKRERRAAIVEALFNYIHLYPGQEIEWDEEAEFLKDSFRYIDAFPIGVPIG